MAAAWALSSRFRASAYGWRGTRTAIDRLDDAVAELRRAATQDPALAAEGSVLLLAKISPAICDIDSSSGALGNAVRSVVEHLVPIITAAHVAEDTRAKWLDRLFDGLQDDDPPYLESLGKHWWDLCASAALAGPLALALMGIDPPLLIEGDPPQM